MICNNINKSPQYGRLKNASLVKRLRRCPLTAESAVRFRYEVLTVYNSPTRIPDCFATWEFLCISLTKCRFCDMVNMVIVSGLEESPLSLCNNAHGNHRVVPWHAKRKMNEEKRDRSKSRRNACTYC